MKNIFQDKSKLNLGIDIIMLLLMMPVAGIGFLIKYVLVPGTQRNELYGSDVDLEFLGMARHDWGKIHFLVSIVFLALLILHILMHWKMIVRIFRRMVPHKPMRITLTVILAIVGVFLISFPAMVNPEIVERGSLHKNREVEDHLKQEEKPGSASSDFKSEKVKGQDRGLPAGHRAGDEVDEINGSQTLQSVADQYGIPPGKIAADLNIPDTKTGEKLGRLRKQYSFTMDDVRKSIIKNRELQAIESRKR